MGRRASHNAASLHSSHACLWQKSGAVARQGLPVQLRVQTYALGIHYSYHKMQVQKAQPGLALRRCGAS